MSRHLLRVEPKLRNVLIVASTHRTTLALAQPFHHTQRTLLVYVQSDYSEIFSLHQLLEKCDRFLVHLLQRVLLQLR